METKKLKISEWPKIKEQDSDFLNRWILDTILNVT